MSEVFYETIDRANCDYPYIALGYHNEICAEHFHEEVELLYVYKGEIIVTIDSRNEVLRAGDICLVMPNQSHTLITTEYNEMCVLKIFPMINMQSVRIEKNIFKQGDENYQFLRNSIDEVIDEHRNKYIGYELAVTTVCGRILLNIYRDFAHEKKSKNKHRFVETINSLLEQSFDKKVNLDEIAEKCGYTKSYFSRRFKEVMNVNFSEYCIIYKLKRSVEMLEKTDRSIEQIALKCGFLSVRSYSRVFKKYYNISPGKYRQKNAK